VDTISSLYSMISDVHYRGLLSPRINIKCRRQTRFWSSFTDLFADYIPVLLGSFNNTGIEGVGLSDFLPSCFLRSRPSALGAI